MCLSRIRYTEITLMKIIACSLIFAGVLILSFAKEKTKSNIKIKESVTN